MKQEAIAQTLIIERMGEMRHFQILLPRDTNRIIGFEYSVSEKYEEPFVALAAEEDPFVFLPNKIIGSIVLKANGCEGVFYQGDIVEDRNIHFGENVAPDFAMPWSHGRKRHEIELNIKENRIVYGFFKDCLGAGVDTYVYYRLNLYLWIEKCEQ
jgi:hypothetical protein